MPATAWSVMIRLATTSGAPAEFGKLAKNARHASTEVRQLNRQIGMLKPTIDRVEPSILRMGSAFKTLSMDGKAAFNDTGRAAARLSRTVLSAGRVSASSFNAVTNTMSRVRSEANAASSAIGHMAAVARTVPRSIGPAVIRHAALVGGGAAAADAGGSGSGALGVAAVGAVAGSALLEGIRSAGDLQQIGAQLSVAGGRGVDPKQFTGLAMQMSMTTAQSVSDSLNLLKVLATNGIPVGKLSTLAMPIARYADVNYLATGSKHVAFEDSANIASGLAHDLQIYDPARMGRFLQTLYRASYQSGHGPHQMATQMRYYAARAKSSGMSDDDIVNLYPLMDRFGLGAGRGGSGINMLLKNLQDPRGKKKYRALREMGIYDKAGHSQFIDEASGKVNFNGFLAYVAEWREKQHLNKKGALANRLISRGFDTNAANVLENIGTRGGMEQQRRIREAEKRMPTLQQAQERLMAGLNSQTRQLTSNFATLMNRIADPLIPDLTNIVHNLAQFTGNLAQYFAQHPGQAKVAALTLGGVTAAGVVAALAAGGYVAHAALAPVVARLVGGHGSYIAARGATDVAHGLLQRSLVGTALVAGGTGAALLPGLLKTGGTLAMRSARGVGNLAGLGAFPGVGGLFKAASHGMLDLALDASFLGRTAAMASRGGIFGITRAIGMFGLRAIPVIGEIVMLIQAIQFLGNHAKDIGHVLGSVAGWIRYRFGPMVLGGIKAAFSGLASAVTHPRQALQSFSSFLMSVFGWISDKVGIFNKAFGAGMEEQNGKRIDGSKLPSSPLGLRLLPRASRSFDQPLHAIPAPRPVTGAGPRVHAASSSIVINANVAYSAPQGEDEVTHRRRAKALVRDHAQHVAAILADKFGADMHAGGAIPQLAGFSHHALLKGAPS